jgi:hypothetical protein
MEDKLSQNEAKLQALAESAPAAIILAVGEDLIYRKRDRYTRI